MVRVVPLRTAFLVVMVLVGLLGVLVCIRLVPRLLPPSEG
ncbi:hypothetical protein GCM10027174_12820 [Salinifilum aidingensis]